MTAKHIAERSQKSVRLRDFDASSPAEPLSDDVKNMSDEEIEQRIAADPDADATPPGFWDEAVILEPDTTEQITLRLPKRVLRHFRASGKGYQSRISAVLSSYVDAMNKRAG